LKKNLAAGKYIYCISDLSSSDVEIGNIGLFDAPVRFLSYKGIGAFVSDLGPEKVTPDIETITGHQKVVEASRKICTTLPVKFGVIFNNDGGVKQMLAKDFEKYKSKLSSFKGKDEFGVKVIQTSKPELKTKTRRAQVKNGSRAGTEYLLALKREETDRMDRLRSREKTKQAINDELAELADRTVSLRADIPQILLNSAYLVRRANQSDFITKGEELREKIGVDGLMVHVSGPWAPYSFC
jgi:hypothetical protein